MSPRVRVLVALTLSGFAGVGWQLLWVRAAGLVLGGTVVAVSLVGAVFLAGLGVGAHVGGRIADRTERIGRLYAGCELFVAGWGLVSHPLLVALADSGLGGLVPGEHGWLVPGLGARAAQVAFAILLVGPPTVAMGASLPLLGRAVVGQDLGRGVAWLAAVNTAGAVLAALVVDTALVPGLGRAATAGVLAGLGVAAALVGRSSRAGASDREVEPAAGAMSPAQGATVLVLSGAAAMGLEVLQVRFLGSALGPYRAVFALTLAILLTGWAVGARLGARIPERHTATALGLVLPMVGLLGFAGLLAHDPEAMLRRQLADPSAIGQLRASLLTILPVVAPAALAMGMVLPLVARATRRAETGRAVGDLWWAQSGGNALGAVLTGLVLLPALGLQGTSLLLAGIGVAAGIFTTRHPLGLLFALPVGLGLLLPPDQLLWASFPAGRAQGEGVRAVREGVEQSVVVTGPEGGPARLWTNGHPMSSTTAHAQRYMRLMAHVPLLAQDAPERALVICFGVGNTLHATSLHPLHALDLADTSRDVLELASLFGHANRGVLEDPRLTVHIDDGRHVLAGVTPDSLDLVTLEPPPIAQASVASLYTEEFYALARSRLRSGGWMTQWLPAYQVPAPVVLSLVKSFVDVFPGAVLLVGDDRELFLAGVRDGTPALDGAAVARRLAERPGVAEDLRSIGVDGPADLALLFGASGDTLAAVTAGATPMVDDRPLLEAAQRTHVTVTRLPDRLLDPVDPERFTDLAQEPAVRAGVSANRERWMAESFLRFSNLP